VLAVALRHARRLGTKVPDHLVELPGGRVRHAALAPLLEEDWPLATIDARRSHWLRYALWESRRRQAMLLVGEFSQSRPRDLPRALGHVTAMAIRRWWQLRGSTRTKRD
jgi:hypothetical protein